MEKFKTSICVDVYDSMTIVTHEKSFKYLYTGYNEKKWPKKKKKKKNSY